MGDGTLAPGESAGNTAITGNYTQNVGTLAIEIGGVFDGQFDTVEVAGNASLGGMLNVTLIAGFEPVLGNSFTILTTEVGNVAGKFAGVSLPIFDELTFDIVYDLNNVVLEVVEVGLHADYNENGVVDAADYTVWRDTLGSMGLEPYSLGDGNGDGDVTQANYDIWRSHFGQSIPAAPAAANASTPVPEPGVLSLVLGIASISWICDFGKRRTVRTP